MLQLNALHPAGHQPFPPNAPTAPTNPPLPPLHKQTRLPLQEAWPLIQRLFRQPADFAVASTGPDGQPHITPIGSILLNADQTGMFVEKFTTSLPRNLAHNDRICVYAGNDSWTTFALAMLRGHTNTPMGVRLYGRVGPRRPLSNDERSRFLRKVRLMRWTRGHDRLWGDLTHARDVTFDNYEPVLAGSFTRGQFRRDAEPSRSELHAAESLGGQVARHPRVADLLRALDHADVKIVEGDATLREFIAGLGSFPPWMRGLFRARGLLAKALRLHHDDPSGLEPIDPQTLELEPGKPMRFFTTRAFEEDAFWVAGSEDRHLAAWLAVVVEPGETHARRFHVVTLVRYKDWTGPVYFNLIRPFHHLIVWALARRAAAARP
jgi:Protein of unknown function (DUF2867)/Pyridoxamine 5'-phosphate oxidase